jgi:hypothetical protein
VIYLEKQELVKLYFFIFVLKIVILQIKIVIQLILLMYSNYQEGFESEAVTIN